MTKTDPGFVARLSGAFAISSALFLPVMLFSSVSDAINRGHLDSADSTLAWILNGLDFFAICIGVILVTIFLVAYPVERWLVKPNQSALRAASTYVLVFALLMGIGVLWAIAKAFIWRQGPTDFTGIVIAYGSFVALLVAFFARLLYPITVRFKRTNLVISVALIAVSVVGFVTPTITATASVNTGFYPEKLIGEIARGTYEIDETNGSGGTESTNGTFVPTENSSQAGVFFACSEPDSQAYQILVRSADYTRSFADIQVTCTTTEPTLYKVNLGSTSVDVNVIVTGVASAGHEFVGNSNGVSSHPDAYAILANNASF